jgi:Fe-S oxidoreductase
MPWLANARDRLPGVAALTERLMGLSAARTLPRWRRDTFMGEQHFGDAHDANVVLLVDTFSNYFEPENARAAFRVLRTAGYRVHVARPDLRDREPERPLCCGRTYLAAGMVEEARHEASRMIAALAPQVAHGAAIVGLEPSCLLTLRDEFLMMGLGDVAQAVADNTYLIEEFLARSHRAGRLRLSFRALPQTLVHGHCHQKAFDAMRPIQTVLGLIPDLKVEVIESGCCGMAGQFGYDAAHHDVSLRMAELSLLPAVRAAGEDTVLVADGTSCRHQIADGTRTSGSRVAIHAIRVLERALEGPL